MIALVAKIKTWAAVFGLAVASAAFIWLQGRRDGKAAATAEADRANLEAIKSARKVEHEVQQMDARAVHDRLAREWMRDD